MIQIIRNLFFTVLLIQLSLVSARAPSPSSKSKSPSGSRPGSSSSQRSSPPAQPITIAASSTTTTVDSTFQSKLIEEKVFNKDKFDKWNGPLQEMAKRKIDVKNADLREYLLDLNQWAPTILKKYFYVYCELNFRKSHLGFGENFNDSHYMQWVAYTGLAHAMDELYSKLLIRSTNFTYNDGYATLFEYRLNKFALFKAINKSAEASANLAEDTDICFALEHIIFELKHETMEQCTMPIFNADDM